MTWALFITFGLQVPLNIYAAARDPDGTAARAFMFCGALWYAALLAWLWFHPTFWSA